MSSATTMKELSLTGYNKLLIIIKRLKLEQYSKRQSILLRKLLIPKPYF